jgi:hypothetical protein
MLAKAIWLIFCPLSDVFVFAIPESIAWLEPSFPLTLIEFAVGPDILTLAMDFALLILSFIWVAVHKNLVARPMSLVLQPVAFVKSAWVISDDSLPRPGHLLIEQAKINRLFITFDVKIVPFLNQIPFEQVGSLRFIAHVLFFLFKT